MDLKIAHVDAIRGDDGELSGTGTLHAWSAASKPKTLCGIRVLVETAREFNPTHPNACDVCRRRGNGEWTPRAPWE